LNLLAAWRAASEDMRVKVKVPTREWLQRHALRLAMALIPEELRQEVKVSAGLLSQLAKKVHVAMAMRCAEVLHRRYEMTGRERRQGCDKVTERRQGGGAGSGPANGRESSVPERRRIERSEWRAEAGAAGPGGPTGPGMKMVVRAPPGVRGRRAGGLPGGGRGVNQAAAGALRGDHQAALRSAPRDPSPRKNVRVVQRPEPAGGERGGVGALVPPAVEEVDPTPQGKRPRPGRGGAAGGRPAKMGAGDTALAAKTGDHPSSGVMDPGPSTPPTSRCEASGGAGRGAAHPVGGGPRTRVAEPGARGGLERAYTLIQQGFVCGGAAGPRATTLAYVLYQPGQLGAGAAKQTRPVLRRADNAGAGTAF